MSFILNALRKSEQERLSNHNETLENKILLKQGDDHKNKPGWIVILILINSLLITFFIWHFTQQKEKDIAEKSETATVQPKSPVQIKQDKPVTVTEHATAPVHIKQERPVQFQGSKLITPPQITIAQQIKNHQQKQKQKQYHNPPASLQTEQTIQPAKMKQPAPIMVKKSSTEQEEKTQTPDLVVSIKENEPPYLSDMSYDFRLSVPNIIINVFVYSENPADRFIMIDMHKYRVGQQINQEMELQEIRPDSIVVEYQDKVFQIKR